MSSASSQVQRFPLGVLAAVPSGRASRGSSTRVSLYRYSWQRQAAHAQAALGDGMVRRRLRPPPPCRPRQRSELQAASHRMAPRRRPRRRASDRVALLKVPPGFAQIVDLAQCRQRHRLARFHVAHASPFLGLPSRDPKSPLRLGTAAIMGNATTAHMRHEG